MGSDNQFTFREQDLIDFVANTIGLHNQELLKLDCCFDSNDVKCELTLPCVLDSSWNALQAQLKSQFGLVEVNKHYRIPVFDAPQTPLANVKNVIAVASGKGGVGKSACALNLALALKREGAVVGLCDADIYGPSVPTMLASQKKHIQSPDNQSMLPIMAHGIASNSIGYLVDNEHASIWRGPMASKALLQLVTQTNWPDLDYLIVDMPPGTGDIQLTMCQHLPLTAAVVVTTPQTLALNDAQKGVAMFEKLNVPIIGVMENMSYFECGHCYERTAIFSENGADKLAQKHALPLLAKIPLDPILREHADNGRSLLDEQPEHNISQLFQSAARKMSVFLCDEAELFSQQENIPISTLD